MPNIVVGRWLIVNSSHTHRKLNGFSLIEIVLSLFIILALITILLTTSATYNTSRKSNLQGIAGKIASRQIETLRNTPYGSLPPSGAFSDTELSKLPNSNATQTFSDYESSTDIKLAAILISWTEGGVNKSIKMDTLIYRYGL